jgi:F-type H+-transporting ATPase subunit b
MELVTPGLGLIFWMALGFGIVLWILGKFAWKPILKSIKDRESTIEDALNAAEKAKEEMVNLKITNEKTLQEAKEEKAAILKEARKIKDSIIEEAEKKANEKYQTIVESAMQEIQNRKLEAITELKNQLAILSIEVAEKLIKEELSKDDKQKQLINTLLKNVKLN